jgi:hypothetical protein
MNAMLERTLSTPLAFALAYAQRGWHVLPLEPKAKVPLGRLVPRGLHDASTDAETIRTWWAAFPEANVGIALAPSGLVAVDIDPRNGGTETFEQLQAAHGSLRSDVMAFTGGGGEHHVFLVPPNAQISLPGSLGPGIDLKANGYIVAEPSIHPSGKQYGWEASSSPLDGVVPSPLPDWLRSLRVTLQMPPMRPGDLAVDAQQASDAREALYCLNADDYDTWVRAGMSLHSTRWGHPAFAMWCSWSQQSDKFDSTACRKKWQSFTLDQERGDIGLTLAWVFGQAQASGWRNPRAALATVTSPLPSNLLLNLEQLQKASASITWLVKGVVPADSIGLLFGGSGTFKSFIALDMALHVAHGMRWLGRKTTKGAVIFIAAEGGAGLWRRIEAWHKQRGLSWQGIEFYVVPVAVALLTDAKSIVSAAQSVGVKPALVTVDTLAQTFDGEENSASDMSAYLRALNNSFRVLWQCVVMVIHHSGHQATERPRGSSAIRGNVDFLLGVFREEAQMIANLECHKQKDGELFDAVSFDLTSQTLAVDSDGDAVTSLVAAHINSAAELVAAKLREMSSGRGGRTGVLLGMVQNGMLEKALRHEFYTAHPDIDQDSKSKAYRRALSKAMQDGFIEIAATQGSLEKRILVLKEWG